jgi:outer membrane protein OmpA-like peptidoglycan-associated protein
MRSPTLLLSTLLIMASFFSFACNTRSSNSPYVSQPQASPSLAPEPKNLNVQSPNVQVPEIQQPEIQQPEIRIPKIRMPEIRIPEITIPGIRVQQDEDSTIITIASDILFDFDQDTIRSDAETALQQISAAITKRYPQNSMQIQGHTDSIGSNAYNQNLSERRTVAVKRWLEQQGNVALSRMSTIGYGESRPVASNTNPDGSDNPAGRQSNRRVEIVIQQGVL